ncbi:Aste57867_8375 [Aphanomyces stellatus]|uniref:Aste57867_8375 protein n=1 Tax=Aphanomyces stellatus TaxID=120398 RepID=A0A485KK54_9STRA|nr:hypothetical protein As57867_008343 [Aphanomyces stellatus]VFT85261.1 Aste57867_8375 [Aphanomyces stellatus]
MVEGRSDSVVHSHLADLLTPHSMVAILSGNEKKIKELRRNRGNFELADIIFVESIELLRVAYSILSKVADSDDALFQFDKDWRDAQNETDISFFTNQTIHVEVLCRETEIQVYFPQPKEAKFLKYREKKRLLDIMEFGEDNALAAFTSPEARNIAEELKSRYVLAQNPTYEWITERQGGIRQLMFVVCLYINYVLVLGLRISPDDKLPRLQRETGAMLTALGGLFCIICSTLWLYNIATETSFSYARQQLKSFKLNKTTKMDMKYEVWGALCSAAYAIGSWLAVYGAITTVFGFDDYLTYVTAALSSLYVLYIILLAVRNISHIYHFSYVIDDKVQNGDLGISNTLFWFNVIVDMLISDSVVIFTFYTVCAFVGLSSVSNGSGMGYMWFGFPLLDLLAINSRLSNITKAITSNLAPLGVTMMFGAIVIYLFSLIGFFRFQIEMSNSDGLQCSTMMRCFFTYMHYGLLSGGGIGDYMSGTMAHPLDYDSDQVDFFLRLVYDLGFYIIILLLLINLIMGIIIDSFTSLREASEKKQEIESNTCLVCNNSRDDIEYRGILLGLSNSFKRHTEVEHNLWNYLFFIMYLESKSSTDMNGTESFVYEKLQAKEMSWIPQKRGTHSTQKQD